MQSGLYSLEPTIVEQADHYKAMREFFDNPRGLWRRDWG
jgi:hypothetical protein